jgi:hypothetical protein
MASIRARHFFPISFFLLSSCARHPASYEEARKILSDCGLTVENIYTSSGFDYVGTVIEVRKVPQPEFEHKITCAHRLFFVKRIEADVTNGSKPPYRYFSI